MKKLYSVAFFLPIAGLVAGILGFSSSDLEIVSDGKTDYVIEKPDDSSFAITAAANKLSKSVKAGTGADLSAEKTSPTKEKKIIFGDDAGYGDALLYNDFLICAYGDDLVIYSKNDARYGVAVDYITDNLIKDSSLSVESGYLYIGRYDYEYSSVSLLGKDISEYEIVYENSAAKICADKFREDVLEKCGAVLSASENDGNKPSVIIGNGRDMELLEYEVTSENGNIYISSPTASGLALAYGEFEKMVFKENGDIINITDVSAAGKIEKPNRYENYINYRCGLDNTYAKLTTGEKKLRVAYFGGSVTVGTGSSDQEKYSWRARSKKWLEDNFPDAEITMINGAIGASGSHLGKFRVERDIISQKPDLLFIEFAINDKYNRETAETASENYESIIRSVRRALPQCDIVAVYTIDSSTAATGKPHYTQSEAHEKIAQAYDLPSVLLGYGVTNELKLRGNTSKGWSDYFTDIVHMTDKGYEKYAEVIDEFLSCELIFKSERKSLSDHAMADIINEGADDKLLYIPVTEDMLEKAVGYKFNDGTFHNMPLTPYKGYLETAENDNSFEFTFTGKELSVFLNTFTSGTIRYTVDGKSGSVAVNHMNKPIIIAKDLAEGEHTVKLTFVFGDTKSVKIGMFLVR